jgi:hypothetical protein
MEKISQKRASRKVLYKAASHAILEVPQAKRPGEPAQGSEVFWQLNPRPIPAFLESPVFSVVALGLC